MILPSEPVAIVVTPPVQPSAHSIVIVASAMLERIGPRTVGSVTVAESLSTVAALPLVVAAERAVPPHAPPSSLQETLLLLLFVATVPTKAVVPAVAVPVQPSGQSSFESAVACAEPPLEVVETPPVVASQVPPVTLQATLPRAPRGMLDTALSTATTSLVAVPPQVPSPPVQASFASTVETLWTVTFVSVSVSQVPPAPWIVQPTVPPLPRFTSPVAAPEVAPVMPPAQVVVAQSASEPPELFATPSRVPATLPATVVTSDPACELQSPAVIVQREVVVVARTGIALPAAATPRTAPRAAVSVAPLQTSPRGSRPSRRRCSRGCRSRSARRPSPRTCRRRSGRSCCRC